MNAALRFWHLLTRKQGRSGGALDTSPLDGYNNRRGGFYGTPIPAWVAGLLVFWLVVAPLVWLIWAFSR